MQWSQGGGVVHVTGSFNHWGERIPLRRSGGDFVVCLNLLPGTYQFKFIVDNEWRYATDQPTVRDQMGNINNCLTVEDQAIYLHEDPQSGFFGNNPAQAYTQALPDEITLAKEPPTVPAHLGILPLNMSPIPEPRLAFLDVTTAVICYTHSVCISRNGASTTLSCTHRYRGKYVTILIHKPTHPTVPEPFLQQQAALAQQQQQQQQAQQAAAAQQQQLFALQQQQQAAAAAAAAAGQAGPSVWQPNAQPGPSALTVQTEFGQPQPPPSNRPQRNVSWSSDLMDSTSGPQSPPGRSAMEMPPPPPLHHGRSHSNSIIITRSHSIRCLYRGQVE